jgi:hypothetical protein
MALPCTMGKLMLLGIRILEKHDDKSDVHKVDNETLYCALAESGCDF